MEKKKKYEITSIKFQIIFLSDSIIPFICKFKLRLVNIILHINFYRLLLYHREIIQLEINDQSYYILPDLLLVAGKANPTPSLSTSVLYFFLLLQF